MTTYDGRGAEVKAGDMVIWHDNRASSRSGLYTVLDAKTRVKIDVYSDTEGTWVNASSVIVVDQLPHVEGRLNTPQKRRGTKAWQQKQQQ